MKTAIARILLVGAVAGLAACSNMTPQERGTAVGAGVGALGGSALTNGSAVGTLGGAAVGGYIGNQYEKKR